MRGCGHAAGRSKEEKTKKIISSPAARLGEEEGGTVSLKTTSFCSFFLTRNGVVLDKTRRFI
jgi:hypothetical protein